MSEKKEIRIICDRCGQEIQSANAAAFRRFYLENGSDLPEPLVGYGFKPINRNATRAMSMKRGRTEYIMRGFTAKTDDGMLDLCAACAESLSEWWGTGVIEGGTGNPLAKCGVVKKT